MLSLFLSPRSLSPSLSSLWLLLEQLQAGCRHLALSVGLQAPLLIINQSINHIWRLPPLNVSQLIEFSFGQRQPQRRACPYPIPHAIYLLLYSCPGAMPHAPCPMPHSLIDQWCCLARCPDWWTAVECACLFSKSLTLFLISRVRRTEIPSRNFKVA